MALPPAYAQLDVRLLLLADDTVLLARREGAAWHSFPGGHAAEGEPAERALARHLGPLAEPVGGRVEFAAAIEHTGDASDEDAGPWAPGTPGTSHVLTLLFAAAWPAGAAVPVTWQNHAVRPVVVDDLVMTRLAPLPVAWAARHWLAGGAPVWRQLAPAAAEAAWRGQRPSVSALRAQLASRRDQLKGRRFRDAAVAMCALIAAADGRIDPAERDGLRAFCATDPIMANFPAAELERLFDTHLAALAADPTTGKRTLLGDIAKLRGRPDEAADVLRLGEVMGWIDGAFVPVEHAVLREAADVLGLDLDRDI